MNQNQLQLEILKQEPMGSLFEHFCRNHTLQFEPNQWCKRLGTKCNICEINLTHQKCISLCRCYYFCHQQCFIPKFQLQLKEQDTIVKCKQCLQPLKLMLQADYKFSPNNSAMKCAKLSVTSFLLVVSVLGIVLALSSQIKADVVFFVLYLLGLVVSLLIYLVVIILRDIFYVKSIKIKDILSTKLQIQTSAFKDLEIQTCEQLTKDYLIFQSKKERPRE